MINTWNHVHINSGFYCTFLMYYSCITTVGKKITAGGMPNYRNLGKVGRKSTGRERGLAVGEGIKEYLRFACFINLLKSY